MMSSFCVLRLYLPLAGALLLGGCFGILNTQPSSGHAVEDPRIVREKLMQLVWAGQPYEDLIAEYGPPRNTMPIASRRVSIVMYEGLDPVSKCIDTFTVVKHHGIQVIQAYFCR